MAYSAVAPPPCVLAGVKVRGSSNELSSNTDSRADSSAGFGSAPSKLARSDMDAQVPQIPQVRRYQRLQSPSPSTSPRRNSCSPSPRRSAMWNWTEDAFSEVYKISRHADVEVEYRLNCNPETFAKCGNLMEQLCQSPPRKTVDTVLTFVGNVRVHCVQRQVQRIETKQIKLSSRLKWGGLEWNACVAAERPMDPKTQRYKVLAEAAEAHLKGPVTYAFPASDVEQWNLQPVAVQNGVDVEWLHKHCQHMQWRIASKRERVYVCEPYSDRTGGVFVPFAAVVCTRDKDAKTDPTPSLEAPIMVRHRSRQRYHFVGRGGENVFVDMTSAVEVTDTAKPHLTVEVEAAHPRRGADALWLPDDVVMTIAEAMNVNSGDDKSGGGGSGGGGNEFGSADAYYGN